MQSSNAGADPSTGAGRDFVLFDDSSYGPMPPSSSSSSTLASAMGPSSSTSGASKPAFTEYRGPASLGGGSGGGDSPFGSPLSRFDDDLAQAGGGMGSGPSSVGSHGSGTLSSATGVPNRKRQRGNDGRGHSSTSSLTGLATAMGGNAGQQQRQARNSRQRHSISDGRPIPGLADTTLNGGGDDWSLADTSPQNPPSGSFGPPIGALSLGGGGDGTSDQFASLFPELSQQQQQPPMGQASSSSMPFYNTYAPQGPDPSTMPTAMFSNQSNPTPAQEAFARQQVRQDLAAVDQRALRGPLRDIAQGNDVNPGMQANMQAALLAAAQSYVAANEANRGRMADSRAPGIGTGPKPAAPADPLALGMGQQPGSLSQAQRSLLFPGAANGGWQPDYSAAGGGAPAPLAWDPVQQQLQNLQPPPGQAQPQPQQLNRPPVGPRKRSNSFDASFLPASRPWFSQSPPEGSAPPEGMTATLKQMPPGVAPANVQNVPPGGLGMGTGTGWTGEPTNSFNAFDLSGGQAFGQTKPQRRPLTRDRSGLTMSPKEMYLSGADDGGAKGGAQQGWGNMASTLDANQLLSQLLMGDVSTPKGQNNMSGFLGKPPMLRGDTIRPNANQQLQQQAQGQQPRLQIPGDRHAPPTTASSASSGMSLFSPGSSDTTPDTDDSDEKPFAGLNGGYSRADYESLLRSQPQFAQPLPPPPPGPLPPTQQQRAGGPGQRPRPTNTPRFLPSSSSSSEDEDDNENHLVPGRVMGPHGPQSIDARRAGALGNASSSAASSSDASSSFFPDKTVPSQPLGRGRGLQGGYGYMPGSAESGLAIDPADAMKSNAVDATMTPASSSGASEAGGIGGGGLAANGGGSSQTSTAGGDDGSISPSIRSAAQVIDPQQQAQLRRQQQQQQQQQQGGRGFPQQQYQQAAYPGAAPPPMQSSSSAPSSRRSSTASSSSAGSQWEGPDAAEADDDDEDDYLEAGDSAASRRAKGARAGAAPKKTAARRSGGGGGGGRRKSTSDDGGGPTFAPSSHDATHGGITTCNYISPLTGSRCGTEFHRPYDLARHRETIHAKEEASLVRQGKLAKEQCRVLYVEVDPAKSQATQEWKCDGRNGCGSVFSRKDALQRHRRLRNH